MAARSWRVRIKTALLALSCQLMLTGVFWLIMYAMLYETVFK